MAPSILRSDMKSPSTTAISAGQMSMSRCRRRSPGLKSSFCRRRFPRRSTGTGGTRRPSSGWPGYGDGVPVPLCGGFHDEQGDSDVVEMSQSDPAAPALTCRGCAGTRAYLVVDLGEQPASDDFPAFDAPLPDAAWPLQLWYCPDCSLVQLGPVEAFAEEPVRAVESETSRRHAARTVAAVLADHPFLAGGTVREFASHHGGSWLDALFDYGCKPAPDAEPADLVVDVHGLAHEQDVAGQFALRAQRAGSRGPAGYRTPPPAAAGRTDAVRHDPAWALDLPVADCG